MSEVKWIKIATDIFDDNKILLIESMPEADTIIVIWFKLLCMAGKHNNSGVFVMNDRIAYTDEMLATIFRRNINTVRLALTTFEKFGMIEIINNTITIPNWGKHQQLDALEKTREKTRNRVSAYRQRQRALIQQEKLICQYCGTLASGYDHIIPLSKGGLDVPENKVPCCDTCNKIKGDTPVEVFLNENRDRIDDHIVTSNETLSKYIVLSNVTGCYEVTCRNAYRIRIERNTINSISCPERFEKPSGQEEKAVFKMPLNDGTEYDVTQDEIDSNKSLYPNVDVEQAYRNMIGWLKGNPTRKKTRRGIKRFVNAWLAKEQDRGGLRNAVQPTTKNVISNDNPLLHIPFA